MDVIKNPLYINKAFASGCFGATLTGRKHSEETKRKIGEKSAARIRPPKSEESKIKMSKSAKAKWASGTRKNCSLYGENNPMYGKTPPNTVPVFYGGIQYKSKKHAMESLGLNQKQLKKLLCLV